MDLLGSPLGTDSRPETPASSWSTTATLLMPNHVLSFIFNLGVSLWLMLNISVWVIKLGPLNEYNQYDYAVVSNWVRFPVFVIARDPERFTRLHMKDVLEFLEKNSKFHFAYRNNNWIQITSTWWQRLSTWSPLLTTANANILQHSLEPDVKTKFQSSILLI